MSKAEIAKRIWAGLGRFFYARIRAADPTWKGFYRATLKALVASDATILDIMKFIAQVFQEVDAYRKQNKLYNYLKVFIKVAQGLSTNRNSNFAHF